MNSTPQKLSMMPTEKEGETQKDCDIGAHLFANEDDSFANEFVDKVRAIHEYFDKDNDGFLNFSELSSLQLCTSGKVMDGDIYAMVCRSLGCHPNRGMSLETLKLTYAAEGTDVDEDYKKVFQTKTHEKKDEETSNRLEEDVYEVGEDGVDISS